MEVDPRGGQSDGASVLSLEVDRPGLVRTALLAKVSQADRALTDNVICAEILVRYSEVHFHVQIPHLEIDLFVPLRGLSSAIQNCCLVHGLTADCQLKVRVHLADHFGVTGQLGGDDPDFKWADDIVGVLL